MRKEMSRTITSSIVTYATVGVDEQKNPVTGEKQTAQFLGKLSDAQAHSKVKGIETEKFMILDVEHETASYKMTVEDFIKHAEKVNEEEEEKTNGGNQ